MQAFQLSALAVAFDPRGSAVDDVADARNGQRSLGHIGGKHDAPLRTRLEYTILFVGRKPRIQGQDFGLAILAPLQRQMRIADFAFTRQEHQRIAQRVSRVDLVHHRDDLFGKAGIGTLGGRTPAQFHRMTAAFHFDHRRIVEVLGKARGVDGGRRDDQLEITALGKQALEIADQEIDVEAALVRLVENDRVVGAEPGIALGFRQQDAIGHELDQRSIADPLIETHLEADQLTHGRAQFAGNASSHRARGNPARLGAADHAGHAATGRKTQLGQLRGLARPGFTGQHDDRMVLDQAHDLLAACRNRQGFVDTDGRHARTPRRHPGHRRFDVAGKVCNLLEIGRCTGRGQALPAADQAAAVTGGNVRKCGAGWQRFGWLHSAVGMHNHAGSSAQRMRNWVHDSCSLSD